MNELKLALRQLERAHRRSLRFAKRIERRDPELAARARLEAEDVARAIAGYRVLLDLEAGRAPASTTDATPASPRESVATPSTDVDTDD